MPADTSRKGRNNALPVRRDPAFPPITDHLRTQHQVLHHEILVALEPRSGWRQCLEHLLLDDSPRYRLATTLTLAIPRRFPRARVLHAARLNVRPPLQAFEPGDLLALLGDDTLEFGHVFQQLYHQPLQLRRR